MNNLNHNMRRIRYFNTHNKYYSQKDIAEILQIPQTQISRIENGHQPRLNEVLAYSSFFKVSLEDLIFKNYNTEDKKFY